jgi:ribonuclease HI
MEIYTDGGCIENPGGIGAWAFVAIDGGQVHRASGAELETTNNRMELRAVIEAMLWANKTDNFSIRVSTDSDLTVKCGNGKWKRRANRDLWAQFDAARTGLLDFHLVWVRGHNGNRWNEEADRLCTVEMQKLLGWREAHEVATHLPERKS